MANHEALVKELQAEAEAAEGKLTKKRAQVFRRIARDALEKYAAEEVTYDAVLDQLDMELPLQRKEEAAAKKQKIAGAGVQATDDEGEEESEDGSASSPKTLEQGAEGGTSGVGALSGEAESVQETPPGASERVEVPGPSATVQCPADGDVNATRPPSPAPQTVATVEAAEPRGGAGAEPQYFVPPEIWVDRTALWRYRPRTKGAVSCYVCGGNKSWKRNFFRQCDNGNCQRAVHMLSCGRYKKQEAFTNYFCPPCSRARSAKNGCHVGLAFQQEEQEVLCTEEEYRKLMTRWNANGATAILERGPKELRLTQAKSAETCLPDAVFMGLKVLGITVNLTHIRKNTVMDFGGKKESNIDAILDYLGAYVPSVVYRDVSCEMQKVGGAWLNMLKTKGRVFIHHIEMEFKDKRFRHCVMVSTVKENETPYGKIMDNMKFSTPVALEEKDSEHKGAASNAFKMLFSELVVNRIAPRNMYELALA